MHGLGKIMQWAIDLLIYSVPSIFRMALVTFFKINDTNILLKIMDYKIVSVQSGGDKKTRLLMTSL